MLVSRDGWYYSCNPKALAEFLSVNSEWEVCFGLISSFHTVNAPSRIRFFTCGTFSYFYYLATSRFFITNERVTPHITYPFKKREQVYIHTMHGGHGIKKTPAASSGEIEEVWKYIEECQDVVLSNSSFFSKYVIRKGFRFEKPIIETGLPRNDIFYSKQEKRDAITKEVKRLINLPTEDPNLHILIYGPTFRYGARGTFELYDLDVRRVLDAFEQRFGGVWVIAISKHPFLERIFHEQYDYSFPYIIDASVISDVQDLLIAGDALITDYSSIEMDFSLTGKPQFQFFVDGNDWQNLTYIDPKALPFPYAEDNDELISNILNFDEETYKFKLSKFNNEVVGLFDDGHACERVEDWMKTQIRKKDYEHL